MTGPVPRVAARSRIPLEAGLTWPTLARLLGRTPPPAPFQDPRVEWLFCGSVGLFRAARRLGLRPGDVVLLPAYNCGSEIDAILAAGADVAFYAVGHDGRADLSDLARRHTPRVKAVLVIHHFGFPQPIAAIVEWARSRGLWVIEDCAHAWLSRSEGQPLGTFGDIAVFSPRKSLPIPDGGVLLPGPSVGATASPLEPPDWRHCLRELVDSAGRSAGRPLGLPLGGALRKAVRRWSPGGLKPLSRLGSQEDFASVAPRLNWRMSGVARRLLCATDHDELVRRRRSNFSLLLERLPRCGGLRPLFDELPAGVCPLYFPVVSEARDALRSRLEAHGVDSHRFWRWSHSAIPAAEHPNAGALRSQLLVLPIHQGLGPEDVSFMAEAVGAAAR
jgi:dTDP-4-amino-4,6-dideoxygalactose transaminase